MTNLFFFERIPRRPRRLEYQRKRIAYEFFRGCSGNNSHGIMNMISYGMIPLMAQTGRHNAIRTESSTENLRRNSRWRRDGEAMSNAMITLQLIGASRSQTKRRKLKNETFPSKFKGKVSEVF